MRALKLMNRTSSQRTINLAAWHSPHSLTWSWILAVTWVGFEGAGRPLWSTNRVSASGWGIGLGLARLLTFWSYLDNNGRQWGTCVLGCEMSWSRQKPMFFRDMWQREQNEKCERSRQRGLMQQFGGDGRASV